MMYVRFPLSLRNVEDLLFERRVDLCHETVRMWWNRFGPMFADNIRRRRISHMKGFRHWRWHLDEMYVKLNLEMVNLWRAVNHEGEILESYVTKMRDKSAALAFMKKALKRYGPAEAIVTGGVKFYPAAMRELGNLDRREMGRWDNNRAENSHLPFRRRARAMRRFRRMKTLQKFASVHANVHNQLASPPFGSILNATSSIAKRSMNPARPHWPSGGLLPPERPDKSPICIVERRVRTRLAAPFRSMGDVADAVSLHYRPFRLRLEALTSKLSKRPAIRSGVSNRHKITS